MQRLAQHADVPLERRRRIDIDRRADFPGDLVKRHALAMQAAVDQVEMVHGALTLVAGE